MVPPSAPPDPSVPSSPPPGAAPTSAGRDSAPRATLPRELSEFLLQFSIALHRFGIYPPGHPALEPLTHSVHGRILLLLAQRTRITLGVAQSQLVIEGVATDRRNPVLLDLAKRLHAHQIGAITLRPEITEASLQWVFDTLSVHPDRSGEPEGLRPPGERPPLPGITLHPLGYDLLSLQKSDEVTEWRPEPVRAMSLWLGLAQAAMASASEGRESSGAVRSAESADSAEPPEPAPAPEARLPDGAEVARSLAGRRRESAYEQVIVGYLLQIAEELRSGSGAEVDSVRRRMVELVRELDDDTLERILRMGGDTSRMRSFVLDSSEALNLDAVLKLLRAAAASTERSLSTSLTRMLTKLALHSEQGSERVRHEAGGAFRETVEELLMDWSDPDDASNPEAAAAGGISRDYGLLLDTMARAAPVFPPSGDEEDEADAGLEGPEGSLRLLQTALEVEGDGPMVAQAVSALTAEGKVMAILHLADQMPEDSPLASRLRKELTTPEELARLLGHAELDPGVVAELAERLGETALDTLLDALENSDSRTVRRRAFDTLSALGELLSRGLAPRIPELAHDPRWFVRRNLLALLRSSGEIPPGFSPLPFLADADPRVRRVALQMAVEVPEARDEAVRRALADPDPGVRRTVLLELQADLPASAVPVLIQAVLSDTPLDDDEANLRTLALRALRGCPDPRALAAALRELDAGRSLLGRRRLPEATPAVREALGVALSPPWHDHPDVEWIRGAVKQGKDLQLARWVEALSP